MRNEVHLCNFQNGHTLSTDCWCEPVFINWVQNKFGVLALIVEHSDDTPEHRTVVLARRERDRTTPCVGNFVDLPINRCPEAPWVTRALDEFRTKQLPPPDPNERSL